jgi:UBX domain-containing protein 1/4
VNFPLGHNTHFRFSFFFPTNKTREEMEKEQRKREAEARKREKQEFKRERDRIRAELEKDKRERMTNKGKLQSTLGVDGYNPSAIQYDTNPDGPEPLAQKQKTSGAANAAAKIDEYITKVSSYRAGGDGGKCLKILKLLVGNAADNPEEEKFKKINLETNAYKSKVKPFVGAKSLLVAVGFSPQENDPTHLILKEDVDYQLLKDTKEKLEKAMLAYG